VEPKKWKIQPCIYCEGTIFSGETNEEKLKKHTFFTNSVFSFSQSKQEHCRPLQSLEFSVTTARASVKYGAISLISSKYFFLENETANLKLEMQKVLRSIRRGDHKKRLKLCRESFCEWNIHSRKLIHFFFCQVGESTMQQTPSSGFNPLERQTDACWKTRRVLNSIPKSTCDSFVNDKK